jgi:hypothetical protein
VECRKVVFVFQVDDSDLEQSISRIKLIIKVFSRLLKMENSVLLLGNIILDAFRQNLSNIKVRLGAVFVLLDNCLEVF